LLLALSVVSQHVQATPADYMSHTVAFNIPVQPVESALLSLSKQAHIQIVVSPGVISGSISHAVLGNKSIRDALALILQDTGLRYSTVGNSISVTLAQAPVDDYPAGEDLTGGEFQVPDGQDRELPLSEGNHSRPRNADSTDVARPNKISVGLEEVLVTAQKRSERLLDVPAAISAISGDRLESLQASSLADFSGYAPGFTMENQGGPGQNFLVMRGLATSDGSTSGPLVATYIDDLPVSSSNGEARGSNFGWDLVPYDIERIEVLRGPQGTLYGADALGGIVKYVLRKPSLDEFNAQIGGSVESVKGGSEPGYGAHASMNFPLLGNMLGVRASGFYRRSTGYIDNIGTDTKDANRSRESGGRISALWKPAENVSVQATVLAQDVNTADQTGVSIDATTRQPAYGSLTNTTYFPMPYVQQARNYSLSINWELSFATLTNAASWSQIRYRFDQDLTNSFGALAPSPDDLVDYTIRDKSSKFTEEVRLTSPERQQMQWLAGAFYTREGSREDGTIPVFTATYVPLASDNLFIYSNNTTFKERALFANLRWKFNDRFDAGAGGRYSQNTETDCTPESAGLFGGGAVPCAGRPYFHSTTWSADGRLHLDQDSMFYVRYATGYRPGGCNNGCVTNDKLQVTGAFGADRTVNYEFGFKGQFLDQRLQADLAIFRIKWLDIQVTQVNSLNIYSTVNGSEASSTGFELATVYRPLDHFMLQGTLSFTDAFLTKDPPTGVSGKRGDQLADSPLWSGSLLTEYQLPLSGHSKLVFGAGYRYRDRIHAGLPSSGSSSIVPQNIVDLYMSTIVGPVAGRLYVRNLFDQRAYSGIASVDNAAKPVYAPVQPRTIGVSLDYRF